MLIFKKKKYMFLFLYKISTYILEAQLTKGKWDKIISSDGYITYFTKKLNLQLPLLDMSWLLTTDQHYIMQSIRFPQHLDVVPLKETRHWYNSFLPGKTKKKKGTERKACISILYAHGSSLNHNQQNKPT